MQGTHGHLSTEQKRTAFRLRGEGWRLIDIAKEIGCTAPMVGLMVRDGKHLEGDPLGWEPRPGCLTIEDREQILVGISRGDSLSSIAGRLGRPPSTITREVNASGGRDHYSAWQAHQRARDQARRPKPCKLRAGRLRDEVAQRLQELWSPDEISKRLILEFPDDPTMRVSHETIYQSLFVQGRGELRRELARCLRSGRTRRRTRGTPDRRGRIPGMVMIADRPAEIEDRAVPGHWEGDLILGENGRSAVGTLVERTTRLVLLLHLKHGRAADSVDAAMRKAIATLPDELRRSITWDQGAEMSNHVNFTTATGIPIYFCDPHSPWQRGSNENTNGLVRQYLPKGTDLAQHTAEELVAIQTSLNNRPRKTLGYLTPSEAYAQVLAATG
jgi:IS30 family transposase